MSTTYNLIDQPSQATIISVLRRGAAAWNKWRATHPGRIDLSGADLSHLDLRGMDFSHVYSLDRVNLSHTLLTGAKFNGSHMSGIIYTGATMTQSQLYIFEEANRRSVKLS